MEIFKEIEGYEGLYAVSNYGHIKSLPRKIFNHKGFWNREERIIKPEKDSKGYLRVSFCVNGKSHTFKVHRLVAQAFIPNPECKPQVNHIDGNKQNNNVENLEWCTNQENQIHAVKTGLYHKNYTPSNSRKILQINKDTDEVIAKYPSINAALRHFNLSVTKRANIVECCRGKQKTGYGYKWKYEDEMK